MPVLGVCLYKRYLVQHWQWGWFSAVRLGKLSLKYDESIRQTMLMKKPKSKPAGNSLAASFRDPAGFVFFDTRGKIYRQINNAGKPDYELFMNSGLYDALVHENLLVPHKEDRSKQSSTKGAYKVLCPQQIPVISYPFEWSFSQLKDAALLTLKIQTIALQHGMTLKDASAYNVQFLHGKPVFIDTLSFEAYHEGQPWQAYRQFCQHFLAPLLLMQSTDIRLQQLLRDNLDGIPLDLTSKLLPRAVRVRPAVIMHIVLHGRAQQAKANSHQQANRKVTLNGLLGILGSLERMITKLHAPMPKTEWGDYYNNTNYSDESEVRKAKLVTSLIKPLGLKTALDLGGNDGRYSRALHKLKVETICTDIDPVAVEKNYQVTKRLNETQMLPMLIDLTNPGGALGWANNERGTIQQRFHSDLVMALALIHHLAISNNLPFDLIARYFADLGNYLLIEFVPKDDSQVQKLLATRKDIFGDYTEDRFISAFNKYYRLIEQKSIRGTKRTLYLFKAK